MSFFPRRYFQYAPLQRQQTLGAPLALLLNAKMKRWELKKSHNLLNIRSGIITLEIAL